tara:strand:- start:35 stop:466 length:432 start_codon:yes stop_codon:yes gene_type:complete
MLCPYCNNDDTRVIESRLKADSVRRRRECLSCTTRFTTYERPMIHLLVTKKDGSEEPFQFLKIRNSIQRACCKAEQEQIDILAKKIERKVLGKKTKNVKTNLIGKLVLNELKRFDKIAYLRYATIHKQIEDPKLLQKELKIIA